MKRRGFLSTVLVAGLAALLTRSLPECLPADLAQRVDALDELTGGPAVGPFSTSHDLWGDGSLLLIPLPGHAPGQ